jgi:predicted ribonuclease YlaK
LVILDTSSWITTPIPTLEFIRNINGVTLLVPLAVMRELDNMKNCKTWTAQKARCISHFLEESLSRNVTLQTLEEARTLEKVLEYFSSIDILTVIYQYSPI